MKREIKVRLIRHKTFLETELQDFEDFRSLSREDYFRESAKRRNVERWLENIINSSIDISKIILVSENITLQDTYKDLVLSLSLVQGFSKEVTEALSEWVRLRNIIAHEYLDIRWVSIEKFIREAAPLYRDFLVQVKEYLAKQIESSVEEG